MLKLKNGADFTFIQIGLKDSDGEPLVIECANCHQPLTPAERVIFQVGEVGEDKQVGLDLIHIACPPTP